MVNGTCVVRVVDRCEFPGAHKRHSESQRSAGSQTDKVHSPRRSGPRNCGGCIGTMGQAPWPDWPERGYHGPEPSARTGQTAVIGSGGDRAKCTAAIGSDRAKCTEASRRACKVHDDKLANRAKCNGSKSCIVQRAFVVLSTRVVTLSIHCRVVVQQRNDFTQS